MIAKIFSKGLTGRIIMASNYARAMAVEAIKQPLSSPQSEFMFTDPKNYYVQLFNYLGSYVLRISQLHIFYL